jgi:hypothetical protein
MNDLITQRILKLEDKVKTLETLVKWLCVTVGIILLIMALQGAIALFK